MDHDHDLWPGSVRKLGAKAF